MFKTSEGKIKKGKIELPKEVVKEMGKESEYMITYDSEKKIMIISTHEKTDQRDKDIVKFRNLLSQGMNKEKRKDTKLKLKLQTTKPSFKDYARGLFIYNDELYFKYTSSPIHDDRKINICYRIFPLPLITFRQIRISELKKGDIPYKTRELAEMVAHTVVQPVSVIIKNSKNKEGMKNEEEQKVCGKTCSEKGNSINTSCGTTSSTTGGTKRK